MKTFVKRTLLFTVLVLCLFAISMLAASAAPTGETTASDSSAACFTSGGKTYYYASYDTAFKEAIAEGAEELVVLQDTSSSVTLRGSIVVRGAIPGVKISMGTKGLDIYSGSITFKDVKLDLMPDSVVTNTEGPIHITFENTEIVASGNYSFDGDARPNTDLKYTFINSKFTHKSPNPDAYMVYVYNSNITVEVYGLEINVRLLKTFGDTTVNFKTSGVTITGDSVEPVADKFLWIVSSVTLTEEYVNDSAARTFSYTYRVGDTEGGKPGEVYFTKCAEAFEYAAQNGNKTVYNIAGPDPVIQETYDPNLDFQNDGEAKTALYCFRIGETQGGNKNVVYFDNLAKALEAVADGGTIYIIGNREVATTECVLTKSVSFVGAGLEPGQRHTLSKYKDYTSSFFLITEANVTITIKDVAFYSAAADGCLFDISGMGSANITMINSGLDTPNRPGIRVQGASAVFNIEGGTFIAYTLFKFTGNSRVELNVTGGAVLTSTGTSTDSSTIYVDTTSALGDIKITLKDVEMKNHTKDSSAIWLMKSSKVDLTMENVYVNVKSWCVTSDSSVVARVNLTNVTFISTGATPVRLSGAKGSFVNIFSGTFLSEASADTFNSVNGFAIVNFGGYMAANFYDGFFSSEIAPLISALNTTVTINIYGGTYSCTSVDGKTSPISLPSACTLNIYGGTFRNDSRVSPVFSNVTDSRGSLTLYSYHAYGNANLIVNLGKGTPTALHTGFGSSSLNTIVTSRGATPVLVNNTVTGLSFKATVSADTLKYFQDMALDSAVSFGMLIVPTDMIADGATFSHYGLANSGLVLGEDFFEVNAGTSDIEVLADGSLVITLAYTGIAQEDFNTAYSVVFYADLVDAASNAPFYFYSAYDKTENSRSVAQVASVAYNDATASYTAEQLAALANACGGDTAQKTLDIFLVAGGSNAVGNTPYNSNFANAFDQSSISANIFYSGMISERATQVYAKNTVHYLASQYTAIGAAPTLDLGWADGTMGFEVGMAQKLSELYNEASGKYAAIIKFATNDATLAGADAADAGNWNNLYDKFIAMVAKQIADYTSLGYKVNVVGMYWMQGEKDVAQLAAYENALNALIAAARADLSDVTGADLSDMPVVVGEIATFLNLKTSAAHAAFVAMQNELATDSVILDPTSLYMADANGVFVAPDELVSIGARIAAKLVKNGVTAIDSAALSAFQIPAVELVADIFVAGNKLQSVTSIAMALACAPVGSTIKLNVDMTPQSTINIDGISGIILDGNGTTISVNFDEEAFNLKNSSVVFHNVKLAHTGDNVGFKLDDDSKLFISGSDTNIATNLTAFDLTGKNAQLVIMDGSFKTTNESALGAIIHTNNGDVEINGGFFEAAAGTSCIVVDRDAPSRLAVDVAGGSFKTTAAGSAQPAAFVNECPVAILVIDPTVVIDAGATINKGVSE